MTQILAPPAERTMPEKTDENRPPVNLNLALAKTVTFFLRALNKGDVNLSLTTPLQFRHICDKVFFLMDQEIFQLADRPGNAPKEVQERADEYVLSIHDSAEQLGAAALDLESSIRLSCESHELDDHDEAELYCVRNTADRLHFSREQKLTRDEWGLVWHAVRYRITNGPRESDQREAEFLSEHMEGVRVEGFIPASWAAANSRYRRELPPEGIHYSPLYEPGVVQNSG